jgi:signal-transduction protein with cAMP-binding, CBS, and nucleotidyltransferase domain
MAFGSFLELRATEGPARVAGGGSPVRRLVIRPAVSVAESASVGDVVAAMRTHDVSAVVIGEQLGIVTERDLARAVEDGVRPADPVERVVTRQPVVVSGDLPVVDAAALMLNQGVRHLVVDLGPGQVGVISTRDVLAVLLQAVDPHMWLTSLRIAIESPPELWLG